MSHVDSYLLREVRAYAKTNGTYEAFKPIRRKLNECIKTLSTPEVMYRFNEFISAHGRAAVAIAIACTLIGRYRRLDGHYSEWAREILNAAQLPPQYYKPEEHTIIDGLNPTRIFEYAGEFLRLTSAD